GRAGATNLTFVDTLAAAVTLTGQSNSGGLTFAQNGAVLTWEGPLALAPGATVTVTVDGTLDGCFTGAVNSRGWAMTSDGCGRPQAASAPDTFALTALTPAVAVEKRHAPAAPRPGEPVTYTLIVTNTSGSATLTSLTVADTLSGAVTFGGQSDSGGLAFAQAGPLLSWTGTVTLAPLASVTVTIDGVAAACFTGAVDDQAWAKGSNACGTAQGASAVDSFGLVALTPAVATTLAHAPAAPQPGGPVTYTLIVTNTSPSATLTSLTVVDTLPVGKVTFDGTESNSAGLAHSASGQVHAWSGALTLAPGASVTVTVGGVNTCAAGAVDNRGWAVGFGACGAAEAASPV
ncbi:MAG: hypothetical protein AAB368_00285, partial [bacterium]